jgi:hypothetical protein
MATAIREYATTLQDGIIKTTTIIEDAGDVKADKVGITSAVIAAESASNKMQTTSQKLHKEFETTVLPKITTLLRRDNFVEVGGLTLLCHYYFNAEECRRVYLKPMFTFTVVRCSS